MAPVEKCRRINKKKQSEHRIPELDSTAKAQRYLESGKVCRRHGANWRIAARRATRNQSPARRLSSMPSIKTFALPLLPPHLGDAWRQALDGWRGPPSELKQSPFQQLRGPPSPFQELSKLIERMREGADVDEISSLAKNAGDFPIPVAIVPGHLSDEELDALS
jgi:hypothetical protein